MTEPADNLVVWTIYAPAPEHPDMFAVLTWMGAFDGSLIRGDLQLAPTIEDARAMIPAGLIRMDPADSDHPAILETWL